VFWFCVLCFVCEKFESRNKLEQGMQAKQGRPSLSHFTREDYTRFYEPAEDSYLLLEALESEESFLNELQPLVCLEIGSGSGIISTFMSTMLRNAVCFATDLNAHAARATLQTARANQRYIDVIECSLVSALPRLFGLVDVLVFNPPYVPTEDDELGSSELPAAWAGGLHGRRVLDQLLPYVHVTHARSHSLTHSLTLSCALTRAVLRTRSRCLAHSG
jgi:release factor glutamine methyltransferase